MLVKSAQWLPALNLCSKSHSRLRQHVPSVTYCLLGLRPRGKQQDDLREQSSTDTRLLWLLFPNCFMIHFYQFKTDPSQETQHAHDVVIEMHNRPIVLSFVAVERWWIGVKLILASIANNWENIKSMWKLKENVHATVHRCTHNCNFLIK